MIESVGKAEVLALRLECRVNGVRSTESEGSAVFVLRCTVLSSFPELEETTSHPVGTASVHARTFRRPGRKVSSSGLLPAALVSS